MTARSVPVMPNFFAGQKLTGTLMNLVGSYGTFWANRPMARAYQSVTQPVTTGVDTQITMDTRDYDTDGIWQGSTPYNFIIPAGMTGRWYFAWSVACPVNTVGSRDSYLKKNGSRITGPVTVGVAPNNDFTQSVGSATLAANAGDTIAVYLWQNSGSTLSTAVGTNNASTFEAHLESLANP